MSGVQLALNMADIDEEMALYGEPWEISGVLADAPTGPLPSCGPPLGESVCCTGPAAAGAGANPTEGSACC